MLTASIKNMLATSIDITLETGVVSTKYIVIISTVRRQSEVGIQCWIDVGPIVNFCLGRTALFLRRFPRLSRFLRNVWKKKRRVSN